jgi:hypothetical protein
MEIDERKHKKSTSKSLVLPQLYFLSLSQFQHESLSGVVYDALKEVFKRYYGIDVRKAFSKTCVSLLVLLFLAPCLRKPHNFKGNLDKMTVLSLTTLLSASMLLVDFG